MILKQNTIKIEQIEGTGEILSVSGINGNGFKLPDNNDTILTDCDLDSIIIFRSSGNADPLREITGTELIAEADLLPVLALDRNSKILMQAFANKAALDLTFSTGFGHYYSRSRSKLWKKGESSGHTQRVFKVFYSPAFKYIVYESEQAVAACHEGYYSCFYRRILADGNLFQIDHDKKFQPENAYE